MTGKQIKVMLTLEGSGYAVLSLLGALAAGIPLSFFVFSNLNIYEMEYYLPWREMALSYIGILLLCMVLPSVVYSLYVGNAEQACNNITERVLNTACMPETLRSHKRQGHFH